MGGSMEKDIKQQIHYQDTLTRYNVSRLSMAFNITGTTKPQLFFSFLNWVYSFVTSSQCQCIQLEIYTGIYSTSIFHCSFINHLQRPDGLAYAKNP
ncbi:hypothetical protein Bca4012_027648 [Brassica carinata]